MPSTLAAHIAADPNVNNWFGGGTLSQNPKDYCVTDNSDVRSTLAAVPASYNTHPFNGIIMVDCSLYDRFRWMTNAQQNANHPISGNIYALGDPGTPANPQAKTALYGSTAERVSTNDQANGALASDCSRLTIVTSGHIFIQNHILLESLYQMGAATWQDPKGDTITLANCRDLIGLVADRQVVFGLAAPSTSTRQNLGCIVHAAIAALGDPDSSNPGGRTGIRAAWGSVTVEGLQTIFGMAGEIYDCVSLPCNIQPKQGSAPAAGPPPGGPFFHAAFFRNTDPLRPGQIMFLPQSLNPAPRQYYQSQGLGAPPFTANANTNGPVFAGAPANRDQPGDPLMAIYNTINGAGNTPNLSTRGRLVVFGSVTQKKRGAIGAGNLSYDKDFRYDKRLMSIAPPIFPSSTAVSLRVSYSDSAGQVPKRVGGNPQYTANRDLNFLALPPVAVAAPPP